MVDDNVWTLELSDDKVWILQMAQDVFLQNPWNAPIYPRYPMITSETKKSPMITSEPKKCPMITSEPKIPHDKVWTQKIADDNVWTLEMADDNVWTQEMANNNVWTLEMTNSAIINRAKMATYFPLPTCFYFKPLLWELSPVVWILVSGVWSMLHFGLGTPLAFCHPVEILEGSFFANFALNIFRNSYEWGKEIFVLLGENRRSRERGWWFTTHKIHAVILVTQHWTIILCVTRFHRQDFFLKTEKYVSAVSDNGAVSAGSDNGAIIIMFTLL